MRLREIEMEAGRSRVRRERRLGSASNSSVSVRGSNGLDCGPGLIFVIRRS